MQLELGAAATFTRSLTQSDFDRFAALSGDDNPIHVDPDFAARTRFGRTVAHGMMLYSTICRVLGTQLPGPGTTQVEQELVFPAPTYAGEEFTARVEVTGLPGPGLAHLSTVVTKSDGVVNCQGSTLVRLPGARYEPATSGRNVARLHEQQPGDAETLGRLRLGQLSTINRTFTLEQMEEYVDLVGDTNPLYSDRLYPRQHGFEANPVPGGLLGGLISYLYGTQLPGRGTMWIKQALSYPAPAYPGEEVRATVTITRLRPEKHLANLWASCQVGDRIVCAGEGLVYVKHLED